MLLVFIIFVGAVIVSSCQATSPDVFTKILSFSAEEAGKLHTAMLEATKARLQVDASSASLIGGKSALRPEGVSTASSWAVVQTFPANTCSTNINPTTATGIGLNVCYPTTVAGAPYAKAVNGANGITYSLHSDSSCVSAAISSFGPVAVNSCTTQSGSASNIVIGTTAGPTYAGDGLTLTYYDTLGNCQSGSGAIYGWTYVLGNCQNKVKFTCSGSTLTGTVYNSTVCTGPSTESSSMSSSSLCSVGAGSLGAYAFGPYISCYSASTVAASSSCFAGSEYVQLATGAMMPISDVQVGDNVLAFSSSAQAVVTSAVVAVPHPKNNAHAAFQHITLASGDDIKMTADHLVPAGPCHWQSQSALPMTRAADVHVGDCMQTAFRGTSKVVSNFVVTGNEGLYTIVTSKSDELVIVNGIVASPFAVNHAVANYIYNIHRAVFAVAPKFVAPLAGAFVNLAAYFTK